MEFIVAPAANSDIAELMDVQFSVFEGEPYHEALYPGTGPAARVSAGERVLKEWHHDSTQHIVKCTDTETGKIIGFVKWNFFDRERPEEEWKKREEIDWCEGRLKEIATNFLAATCSTRERLWEGRPYCLCALLCVHRDHQRHGAGTVLMQWGLDRAKELGLPAYLEASASGYPLYLKLGFKEIDRVIVRSKQWGGNHDKHYVAMCTKPEIFSKIDGTERAHEL